MVIMASERDAWSSLRFAREERHRREVSERDVWSKVREMLGHTGK